jgi:hypothetical protein
MANAQVNNIWLEMAPAIRTKILDEIAADPTTLDPKVYLDSSGAGARLPLIMVSFLSEEEDHVYGGENKVLHVFFDVTIFSQKSGRDSFENHHLLVGLVERALRRESIVIDSWDTDLINYLSKQNQTIQQDAYQTVISFKMYASWKQS